MKIFRRILVVTALGLVLAFGSGVSVSPAGAQELDLCALLGGQYCPDGVSPATANTGPSGSGGVNNAGLARTGSDFGPLIGIGAGLVLLGGAAAYTGRRRPQGDA